MFLKLIYSIQDSAQRRLSIRQLPVLCYEGFFYSLTPLTSLIWLILILLFLGMCVLIAGRMVDVYLAMSCQKSGAVHPQISSHGFQATKLEGLGFVTEAHHHRCGCDVGLENGVLNRAIGAATSAVCQAAKRIFHGSQHARISIGIIHPCLLYTSYASDYFVSV